MVNGYFIALRQLPIESGTAPFLPTAKLVSHQTCGRRIVRLFHGFYPLREGGELLLTEAVLVVSVQKAAANGGRLEVVGKRPQPPVEVVMAVAYASVPGVDELIRYIENCNGRPDGERSVSGLPQAVAPLRAADGGFYRAKDAPCGRNSAEVYQLLDEAGDRRRFSRLREQAPHLNHPGLLPTLPDHSADSSSRHSSAYRSSSLSSSSKAGVTHFLRW